MNRETQAEESESHYKNSNKYNIVYSLEILKNPDLL